MQKQDKAPSNKLVYVVGDIHSEFGLLNNFINSEIRQNRKIQALAETYSLEVILLQCGDMAFFWPGVEGGRNIKNQVDFLKDGHVKIYWCGGNHEDWDTLDALFTPGSEEEITNFAEVAPCIHFARFGATLEIGPGLKVLFAGGAESADKEYRIEGESWWPQEGISDSDMDRLADISKVDWIISHTAPYYFNLPICGVFRPEPSRRKLDEIFGRYNPSKWFFGHFHTRCHGYLDGCAWDCLGAAGLGCGRWWERVI